MYNNIITKLSVCLFFSTFVIGSNTSFSKKKKTMVVIINQCHCTWYNSTGTLINPWVCSPAQSVWLSQSCVDCSDFCFWMIELKMGTFRDSSWLIVSVLNWLFRLLFLPAWCPRLTAPHFTELERSGDWFFCSWKVNELKKWWPYELENGWRLKKVMIGLDKRVSCYAIDEWLSSKWESLETVMIGGNERDNFMWKKWLWMAYFKSHWWLKEQKRVSLRERNDWMRQSGLFLNRKNYD